MIDHFVAGRRRSFMDSVAVSGGIVHCHFCNEIGAGIWSVITLTVTSPSDPRGSSSKSHQTENLGHLYFFELSNIVDDHTNMSIA